MCKYNIVERFLKQQLEQRPATLKTYECVITKFLDDVSKKINNTNEYEILNSLNTFLVDDMFEEYRNGSEEQKKYKKSTYTHRVITLQKFGKFLEKFNLVEKNPFAPLERFKKLDDKKVKETLNVIEIRDVIEKSYKFAHTEYGNKMLKATRMRFIIALATTTGMRLNEMLNITLDRIKPVYTKEKKILGYLITFTEEENKSKVVKKVPIGNLTLQLYYEYLIERNKLNISNDMVNQLFVNDKGDKKLAPQTVRDGLKRFIAKSGYGDRSICPHSFRKSFRTALTYNNVNENIIRQIGGWSLDSTTTETYIEDNSHEKKFEICDIL